MPRVKGSSLILTIILTMMSAHALAKEKKAVRYGGFVSYSSTTVEDPDGSVDRSNAFSRFGLVINFRSARKSLIEGRLLYHDDSYPASSDYIGQKVKGYGLTGVYYHNIVFTRSFQPWLGVGLSLHDFTYKERFTNDASGFLQQRFADRSKQETSVLVAAKVITDMDRAFDIYGDIQYEYPLDTGIHGVFFNIGIVF